MRKKIRPDQVRQGMYIDGYEGRWLDHPFWRSRYLLKTPKAVATLKAATKLAAVWIDTAKGCDLNDEPVQNSTPAAKLEATAVIVRKPVQQACSADEEKQRAVAIISESKPVMSGLFEQARMGNLPEFSACLPVVENISSSVSRNVSAMTSLLRLKQRDEYTYMHSMAVCALMTALAIELELSDEEVQEAAMAGLLHDIGKSVLPMDILDKPGRLSNAEIAVIKQHPVRGYDMLKRSDAVPQSVLDVCLQHHERADGKGYPYGLPLEEQSLLSRMCAICDVYDAVTSLRVYQDPWEPATALAKMAQWQGQFDEQVFKRFVSCIGIYPVGSLVSLKSGKLAVVVEQKSGQLTKPVVKIFYSIRSRMAIPFEVMDLSHSKCKDGIAQREEPKDWGLESQRIQQLWV